MAEGEARAKKRKAAGLPVEDQSPVVALIEDEEANKRRKVLQEALEMDKDADSDEDEDADGSKGGDTKYVARCVFSSCTCIHVSKHPSNSGDHPKGDNGDGGHGEGDGEEEENDDDDDEEEDDTAELFRELEKIKRERAAEKERVEQAEAAVTEAEREERIATANPLLNLAAALGNAPGINTTAPGTFAVKRRWDDGALLGLVNFYTDLNERTAFVLPFLADLIFKNQAVSDKDNPRAGQFVNDLLRTEFHK
jgi:protein CWC15